jgi:hypothetical protein
MAQEGEAVIGRLGDIATKLPDEVIKATPEIPWREAKRMRIIAAHASAVGQATALFVAGFVAPGTLPGAT